MRIKDARQTFLGIWIRCLLEGRPFEVWGGDQLRDLSYVDDTVEALLLAVASNAARGQVFNVGGEKAVPLMELAKLLVELEATGTYTVREFPVDRRRIDYRRLLRRRLIDPQHSRMGTDGHASRRPSTYPHLLSGTSRHTMCSEETRNSDAIKPSDPRGQLPCSSRRD